MTADLARLTWQQANIAGLWPARSFAAVGVKADTVYQWVHRRRLHPVARGPHGVYLYRYDDVIRLADHARTTDRL